MKLARYLSRLGYGSRREVEQLLADGAVRDGSGQRLGASVVVADADGADTATRRAGRGGGKASGGPRRHADIRVHDAPLDPPPASVVMLHKPGGVVCSTTDPNPVVYDLLPPRFRGRTPVMAPVGRLDRDTTGLLLLTDDGTLLHRITSPRSHLPKRYLATLTEPFDEVHRTALTNGTLVLSGEDTALAPAALEVVSAREVRLSITEGRYHQVRRMFAAVGHHVQALHRESLGPLELGSLPEGQWRVLSPDEVGALERALSAARATSKDAPPLSAESLSAESPPAP